MIPVLILGIVSIISNAMAIMNIRNVNANASKRGKLTEILVRNYEHVENQGIFDAAFVAEDRQY